VLIIKESKVVLTIFEVILTFAFAASHAQGSCRQLRLLFYQWVRKEDNLFSKEYNKRRKTLVLAGKS